MSNLLAALGRAQLTRLDSMIERRRQIRCRYRELFKDVQGVELFGEPDGSGGGATVDNFWLSSIIVNPAEAGWDRNDLIRAFAAADIEARPLWKPMHLQPAFAAAPAYLGTPSDSEILFTQGVSLPSGSALTEQEHRKIANTIATFLRSPVPELKIAR